MELVQANLQQSKKRQQSLRRLKKTPRTCVIIRKGINVLTLSNCCSKDLKVAKVKMTSMGGHEEIIFGSAYLSCDGPEPPPTREMKELVRVYRVDG